MRPRSIPCLRRSPPRPSAAVDRRGRRQKDQRPIQGDNASHAPAEDGAGSLTTGKLNAVLAAFKAGVKPSAIARQFGISQSDVRKALAAEGRDRKNLALIAGSVRCSNGELTSFIDGLLAATAKVHGLTLVTRNGADIAEPAYRSSIRCQGRTARLTVYGSVARVASPSSERRRESSSRTMDLKGPSVRLKESTRSKATRKHKSSG